MFGEDMDNTKWNVIWDTVVSFSCCINEFNSTVMHKFNRLTLSRTLVCLL